MKQYFEMCVLGKLERALKCKEVWVEGAYRFRNPDEDLPADWEERRVEYYRRRGLPLSADEFLDPLREEMTSALETFNRDLPGNQNVRISHPGGGEKGLFHVPKVKKHPERPLIQEVKGRVLSRWGILDLLDMLLESDRQVNFTRFFHTSGARQVIGRDQMRERLLLTIFAVGTNLGLARIHAAARPSCSYDDLRYFRSRYVSVEAVREAIVALVNRVLEIRNPTIWGRGTACASDAKHLEAWDENLTAEWNPHYGRSGIMVYWLVDTNSLCIYSQIRGISETAAMIRALVSHDTEMRVESNFTDSHGQSEVAFAFCRLLGIRLMPRLKRIGEERLYLPESGFGGTLPNLAGVLARPIRWDLIRAQYDDMVRHVVAVAEETGPVDSILRRFNSYNRTNPTYKAFVELGKAEKTLFLCRYLPDQALQEEVNAGLNVVENWNSCNDFVSFGRKADIPTNDPAMQELVVLCQHILQDSLILSNAVMVERVLEDESLLARMEPEDMRALTPLFTANVNPYGYFSLDLSKPSFLEEVS
jgi:TnpA family transposase